MVTSIPYNNNNYPIKTLFNSCERLLLGTLILDIRSSRISDLSFGPLSDLIHGITENGLRHASGPVHTNNPSVTHIVMVTRNLIFNTLINTRQQIKRMKVNKVHLKGITVKIEKKIWSIKKTLFFNIDLYSNNESFREV